MKVWIVTGTTESGDHVGPYAWTRKPTRGEVREVLKGDWECEFECFDDDPDGLISWDIQVTEVLA